MNRADEVFETFVAANPVPDVAVLEADRVPADRFLADVARGGRTMRDVTELKTETDRSEELSAPSVRPPWWRRPPLVVAAAFVAVLLIGAVWLVALAGPEEIEPAEPPEPPDPAAQLEQEAVDAVETFFAAVNAGDIDTVMSLSHESAAELSDERVWRFNAVLAAAGHPIEVRDCAASAVGQTLADVRCTQAMTSPVAVALGMSEVIAPFSYIDGDLAWQPFEGGDAGALGQAFAEYLQQFHPEEYDVACSQAPYAAGSIVYNNGTALTPECAEVLAPKLDDIAQWIGDGRPVNGDGSLEAEAVDAVERFYAAVNAGDIETVMALSHPTVADMSNERMWGFNIVLAAEHPIEVTDCGARAVSETFAEVTCTWSMADPVAIAVEMPDVTLPFSYQDGLLVWRPWEGADFDINRVYSDYLEQFHSEEYDAACSLAPYAAGSVVYSNGIALTPECAEVLAPKLDDIARWVLDGQP